MRRTPKSLLATAALALIGAAGVGTAGAITMPTPDAATTQVPSCSLHPTPNVDGTITFTKDPAKDVGNERFLTVTAEDGTVLFNAWLTPGDSTGPLPVTADAVIHWASAVYPVSAYGLDDPPWCGNAATEAVQETTTTTEAAPTTTAAAPTTTAAPPTTTTTEPVAAPTTTVAAPTTTVPPVATTEPAPVVQVDEPLVLSPAAADVGVAGVTVTRTLAMTGFPVSPAAMALAAAGLFATAFVLITGSNAVSALRRDMRQHVR